MNQKFPYAWLNQPIATIDESCAQQARLRQAQLTKPPGSLGRLEEIVIRLAALQYTERPSIDAIHIAVFAGDHGIAAENISAFPQSVTVEMIKNFARGGAAINVLARAHNASLEVINLGTISDTSQIASVKTHALGTGTANFLHHSAMTPEQLASALQIGCDAIDRIPRSNRKPLFIGGEMGIGNTTSATAVACCLLNLPPEQLTGAGTGLDKQGVVHKTQVITQALGLHREKTHLPLDALQHLGGFEIAALTAAYIRCAQTATPVLIDGFISTVAALIAISMLPECQHWFIFSHVSEEQGHRIVLERLNARPLLDLQMRLGEGSGAAVAISLLRMACQLHNEMATFAEAAVSQKI